MLLADGFTSNSSTAPPDTVLLQPDLGFDLVLSALLLPGASLWPKQN